ncbi:MAG: HAD family hydrolase [Ruminococcaceae bacterium]|nr:HAD family hydrolase [Oscillospiraceae bacterium]
MNAEKRIVLFTDIGDTIIDEGTEIRDEEGTVIHADCIPGARETMRTLYEAGYTIVMVADGTVQSFHNTMTENGLDDIFSARIISGAVGAEKPDGRMFRAAMDALGLTDLDKNRIVMVGNNVKRDILGANRAGLHSVLLTWSNRRPFDEDGPEEHPEFKIARPEELIPLLARLEEDVKER